MFSSSKKNTSHDIICVSVVTSYSVISSVIQLFHHEHHVKPVVLFSCQEILPTYHQGDAEALLEITAHHLKKNLEKCRSCNGSIGRLVCTVGEPWVITRARMIHLEKKDPFTVTQKTIDEMVLRDRKLFDQEIAVDFGTDMSVFGSVRPQLQLNGYHTQKLSKEPVRTIDVHSAYSLIRPRVMQALTDAYTDVFHRTQVSFQSLNTTNALIASPERIQTLVHVGGLTTQVSVVDHGRMMYVLQIPAGIHDLEDGIMREFSITRNLVGQTVNFYGDHNSTDRAHHESLRKVMSAYAAYGEVLERGMFELVKHVGKIPEPIIMITYPLWMQGVRGFIETTLGSSVMSPTPTEFVVHSHESIIRNAVLDTAIEQAVLLS